MSITPRGTLVEEVNQNPLPEKPTFLETNKGTIIVVSGVAFLAIGALVAGGLLLCFKVSAIGWSLLGSGCGVLILDALIGVVALHILHQKAENESNVTLSKKNQLNTSSTKKNEQDSQEVESHNRQPYKTATFPSSTDNINLSDFHSRHCTHTQDLESALKFIMQAKKSGKNEFTLSIEYFDNNISLQRDFGEFLVKKDVIKSFTIGRCERLIGRFI